MEDLNGPPENCQPPQEEDYQNQPDSSYPRWNRPGWIRLHRKLLDHPRHGDPAWVSIWQTLLLLAAYQTRNVVFKGKERTLNPGELITGTVWLAAHTGVSQSKVQRVLAQMESEKQIEQQPSNRNRLITITNWEKYQASDQQNAIQMNNRRNSDEKQVTTLKEGPRKGPSRKGEKKKRAASSSRPKSLGGDGAQPGGALEQGEQHQAPQCITGGW